MKPRQDPPLVRCAQCRHARLSQSGNDPVIAHCAFSPYGQCAAIHRRCSRHEAAPAPKPVDHWPKDYTLNLYKHYHP